MNPVKLSKVESGMRLVLEYNQHFNRHDLPAVLQLVNEDVVLESSHPAPGGDRFAGKAAVADHLKKIFTEKPDINISIEDLFGLGYRCVMCWHSEWGCAGSQRQCVRGVDIFKFKDGLICEILTYVKF